MRYHLTAIRMVVIKKWNKIHIGKDMEKLEPCALLVGMYNDIAAVTNGTAAPQKIKHRVIVCSTNSISGYIPKSIESRDWDK